MSLNKINQNKQVIDVVPDVSIKHGFVSLPLNQEGFKEFITSLLGKPQEIARGFLGSFNITVKDLVNIYYLLEQRIKQQNIAELIQFSAKINYHDDSSVILGSIEELKTYNELRPVISTSINLFWSFLVKFADREHPEKQEIELIVQSDYEKNRFRMRNNVVQFSPTDGTVDFVIRHTARSPNGRIRKIPFEDIKTVKERI